MGVVCQNGPILQNIRMKIAQLQNFCAIIAHYVDDSSDVVHDNHKFGLG